MTFQNKILEFDALTGLRTLPDAAVQCIVTSPPYWGKRQYDTPHLVWGGETDCKHDFSATVVKYDNRGLKGSTLAGAKDHHKRQRVPHEYAFCGRCGAWKGELGQEPNPELFIEHLVEIFNEAWRVLADDGTLWVNIGDTYWGGKGRSGTSGAAKTKQRGVITKPAQEVAGPGQTRPQDGTHDYLKPKDLCQIPALFAIAMQRAGWYLRNEIIWHKTNGMPESVTDRCVNSHEKIFLFTKARKYFFDYEAIQTQISDETVKRMFRDDESGKYPDFKGTGANLTQRRKNLKAPKFGGDKYNSHTYSGDAYTLKGVGQANGEPDTTMAINGKARCRDVWSMPTAQYKGAHFAVFPAELARKCIQAGTRPGDLVCDPFMGSGTTALEAALLDRYYVGFELNPEVVKQARHRVHAAAGLLSQKYQ